MQHADNVVSDSCIDDPLALGGTYLWWLSIGSPIYLLRAGRVLVPPRGLPRIKAAEAKGSKACGAWLCLVDTNEPVIYGRCRYRQVAHSDKIARRACYPFICTIQKS